MDYEKQTNPENENNLSPKTQELKDYVDNLSLEMVAYSKDSVGDDTSSLLILGTEGGGRVWITRVKPDVDKSGYFFQDLSISFHPGSDTGVTYQQLDYNFNEKGDGKLRKRIIARQAKGMENVTDDSAETLYNAYNVVANLQLEGDMGLNNQPVDEDEIDALITQLKLCKVLDPANGYQPVN